jgi:hypothetical protein
MSKQQYKSMEELKEAAREKFTDDEIDAFINMGEKLACYPVLSEFINIIESRPGFDLEGKKLVDRITSTIKYKKCGHISLPLHDENDQPVIPCQNGEIVIGMSLSITKKDEKPEFYAPPEFINDLLKHMSHLIATAKAFWQSYSTKHKKIIKAAAKYCPNVDFGILKNKSDDAIMLYFDENSPTRVCVFTYYYNNVTGEVLIRKPNALKPQVAAEDAQSPQVAAEDAQSPQVAAEDTQSPQVVTEDAQSTQVSTEDAQVATI